MLFSEFTTVKVQRRFQNPSFHRRFRPPNRAPDSACTSMYDNFPSLLPEVFSVTSTDQTGRGRESRQLRCVRKNEHPSFRRGDEPPHISVDEKSEAGFLIFTTNSVGQFGKWKNHSPKSFTNLKRIEHNKKNPRQKHHWNPLNIFLEPFHDPCLAWIRTSLGPHKKDKLVPQVCGTRVYIYIYWVWSPPGCQWLSGLLHS